MFTRTRNVRCAGAVIHEVRESTILDCTVYHKLYDQLYRALPCSRLAKSIPLEDTPRGVFPFSSFLDTEGNYTGVCSKQFMFSSQGKFALIVHFKVNLSIQYAHVYTSIEQHSELPALS